MQSILEDDMEERKLISVKELARILGMSPIWVQRQAKQGKIPGYKFCRDWRFDPEEVFKALGIKKEGGNNER